MEQLARTMIRLRWLVLATWLVVVVVSGMASAGLNDLLTNRFVLPGSESEKAGDILKDSFGQQPEGSFSVVVEGKPGSASSLVEPTRVAATKAAAALETGKLEEVRPVAGDVVTARIVSQLQPAEAKGYTGAMREAAGDIPGATLFVTGQSAIEIVILVFVFGTLAFLLPFMLAAVAIPTTLAFVWIFANFMTLSTYLTNMVTLIGLGIAVDYSLLMVHRYREERKVGRSKEDAVAVTMSTAGRAVVFSGTAVAIGLALMLFMPLPFMRGFGLAGLLIPLVSVAAAITLLPVLMYWLEDRMDRVRLIPKRVIERREDSESNFWARLADRIMKRPYAFAAGTTAALLLLAAPLLTLQLGPGSNEGIPRDLEAVQGLNVLAEAVGDGALAPTDIVIDTGRAGGAADAEVRLGVLRLASLLRGDSEVADVIAAGPQTVDETARYLHVQAIGKHEYGLPDSQEFVDRLRDEIVPAAAFPADTEVLAGGGPAFGVDFLDITYGAFPWLVLAVLLLTYVLLVRAFRSLLLPLKAIVLNLLSIAAAYGILVLAFKFGAGEVIGLTQFDQIEGWIPVFLFAMLFGLSMDYEVFLVSRMREEWDERHDNAAAVTQGLAKTGRLVTAAGLIMFAAFMGFVAGSIVGLQQFGLGLAAAILIDVTIIRALLVPSAMKLFGRWNWWLPDWAARIVRVEASPLESAEQPAVRAAAS